MTNHTTAGRVNAKDPRRGRWGKQYKRETGRYLRRLAKQALRRG